MIIPKRWLTVLGPLSQALATFNLGMTFQRWDHGGASYFTVIVILGLGAALGSLVIIQTRQKLAATQNDHIGSRP